MLNIAIVDDDIHICSHLCEYIERTLNTYDISIDEFNSGMDFVNALKDREPYDVVFMDIQMYPIDGIDAGKFLRSARHGSNTILIYISAYTDNLMPLFSLEPLDFIEKPLEYSKFVVVARKIINRIESGKQYIFFKVGRENLRIRIADIIYAEIFDGRQAKLHMASERDIITYERLSNMLSRINSVSPCMIQIHKSYIINKHHIVSFNNHEVTLSNGIRLSISASFRASVNNILMNSLIDGGICDEF